MKLAQAGSLHKIVTPPRPRQGDATLYGIVTEVIYERHAAAARASQRPRRLRAVSLLLTAALSRPGGMLDAHRAAAAAAAWGEVCVAARRRRRVRGACLDGGILAALAVEILRWVGVATTAGDGVWPLGAWAERRAAATGEAGCSELRVAADVERVLVAMSRRPEWFERYVERPLGKKQTSVAYAPVPGADFGSGVSADLRLVPSDAVVDARLVRTACEALEAILSRVRAGAELRDAVLAVVLTVFDAGTGAEEMDGVPGGGDATGERVLRMMADPATVERVVGVVTELLRDRHGLA